MFDSLIAWLTGVIESVLEWFLEGVQWLGKTIFASVMEGLGDVLIWAGDVVCVRACVTGIEGISSALSSLPPLTIYLFDFFMVAEGIELVICAYVARFLIRRLPIIG